MRASLRDPRTSVLCTGAPTSLPRELHSSDLHMRPRGVPECAYERTRNSSAPTSMPREPWFVLFLYKKKSTRLRLDPEGYIAGDAVVTLRVFSDHKQETDSSTKGLVCLPRNQVKDTHGCTQSGIYSRLFVVSVRNKRHHHHREGTSHTSSRVDGMLWKRRALGSAGAPEP